MVHRLDRLERNLIDLRCLVQKITRRGIHIEFVKENLTFTSEDSPMANLLLSVMGAFAEFERSLISERTKEGLKRAKMEGKQLGRPKGSRDSKKRRKSGYILREAKKRKYQDESKGKFLPIDEYLK